MRPRHLVPAVATLAVLATGCAAPDEAGPAPADAEASVASLETDAEIAEMLPPTSRRPARSGWPPA